MGLPNEVMAKSLTKFHQLIPGVALTEAQIAQLTSDIIWLVEKDVTLPDGTHTRALVPQVYVRVQPGDIDGNGALLAGSNVDLNIGSKFTNSGTIAGRNVVSLTADTINNLGGRIAGNNVALTAKTDLNNLGGLLQGGDSLMLSAGRDINVASTTHTSQSGQGERTNVDRVAGLYVSNPKAVLLASAGRDVNLLGAQIVNEGAGGTTAIAATNNLNLGTVGESYRQDLIFDSRNTRKESSRQEVGTIIQTSGDVQLLAGQDITARAAQVASDKGAVLASAGRDVAITAGEAGYSLDSSSYSKSKGSWGSKKTVTTRDSVKDTTAIASSFSGDTVFIQAGQDITVKGSNVAAVNAATLVAGRDLALETATETHVESHFREEKNSGLSFSVTDGLSYGKSAQNQNLNGQGSTQVGSTLSGANVSTASGRDTRIVASNVLADQNIDIAAGRNIDILAAANTNTTKSEAHSSSASLGLATGLSANFTILSLGSGAENGNGTVVTQSTSLLSANSGSLTLNAGLDSQYQGTGQGNITTQGADLIAKDKITLSGNAIDLQAIANTTAARSHSESKSFTVGARPAGVVGSLISQISDRVTAVSKGTGNSRLDNAMALKAGYDTYKLFNAGEAASAAAQTGADAVKSAGSGASFGVSVTIGSSSSQSNSQSASSQVLGTNLQGKDIALTARETDIHLQAAKLQAENVSLDAARDVLLEAGANTSSLHTDNSSSSASVGVTIGIGQQSGISIQLGMQNAKGKANGSETVYDNTLITATDTLKIKSGNDTTLKGAQLAANHVTLDVGRNLTIETLQNRSQYETEQTSGGFGVSLCIPPLLLRHQLRQRQCERPKHQAQLPKRSGAKRHRRRRWRLRHQGRATDRPDRRRDHQHRRRRQEPPDHRQPHQPRPHQHPAHRGQQQQHRPDRQFRHRQPARPQGRQRLHPGRQQHRPQRPWQQSAERRHAQERQRAKPDPERDQPGADPDHRQRRRRTGRPKPGHSRHALPARPQDRQPGTHQHADAATSRGTGKGAQDRPAERRSRAPAGADRAGTGQHHRHGGRKEIR